MNVGTWNDCGSISAICSRSACPAYDLGLCIGEKTKESKEKWLLDSELPFTSTIHTIPPRRTICHPKDWSEFIPVICHGWAASSLSLPDGRRQILSFLLSGDVVSNAFLFEPMSGRSVESITEVSYRKFKRNDLKTIVFKSPDLFEKISKAWVQERMQADQLALDLGRRTADERICKLILHLMEKLANRGMLKGQTMDFPLRQKHIADATGLTSVHVSKVLGELQRAGLIKVGGRSLTIIDIKGLRRAAEFH